MLVYVPGGSVSIQALVSGDIDLAQLTGPPGVIANLKGADIVYVAMTDDKMGYQLVTRQDVKKPVDLKGKRLGISRFGSSSDFSTKVLLKKIGVDPKDVSEIKYLGNTLLGEFKLDPSFHEEFSQLFKDNCTFLKIGSGFSPDQSGQSASQPTEPRKARDGASTVVLAEPKSETGLRCFVAMPFRGHESARSEGFFDEVLRALLAPAGREAGFEVVTANRDGSDVIQATIVNQLLDADLVIADLTENNPNVLLELGMRIADDKPVALIRAKGTPAIFDVDNMLRVFEYDPNLWSSTVEHDRLRLTDHIKATWDNRASSLTFMKILRERKNA